MVRPTVSDEDFVRIWRECGSPQRLIEITGLRSLRSVYLRRQRLEKKLGIVLPALNDRTGRLDAEAGLPKQGIRRIANVTGAVVVFSDAHFWPGVETVAYKALMEVLPVVKPAMVVANGDILDGARISRHDRIGWENRPRLADEIDAAREKMDAIRDRSRRATHVFNLGNHDVRFAKYLANNAPEVEGLLGTELGDHIRHWDIGWTLMLNDAQAMIKHRWHGGIHAAWNNVVKGGVTTVTGHTHALESRPYTDYRGKRWGIQTGTLLELGPECGPTFYREDAPEGAAAPGFAVLTFGKDGKLSPPALCEVMDGHAYFRGERVL